LECVKIIKNNNNFEFDDDNIDELSILLQNQISKKVFYTIYKDKDTEIMSQPFANIEGQTAINKLNELIFINSIEVNWF
jgi:hypothetical protein